MIRGGAERRGAPDRIWWRVNTPAARGRRRRTLRPGTAASPSPPPPPARHLTLRDQRNQKRQEDSHFPCEAGEAAPHVVDAWGVQGPRRPFHVPCVPPKSHCMPAGRPAGDTPGARRRIRRARVGGLRCGRAAATGLQTDAAQRRGRCTRQGRPRIVRRDEKGHFSGGAATGATAHAADWCIPCAAAGAGQERLHRGRIAAGSLSEDRKGAGAVHEKRRQTATAEAAWAVHTLQPVSPATVPTSASTAARAPCTQPTYQARAAAAGLCGVPLPPVLPPRLLPPGLHCPADVSWSDTSYSRSPAAARWVWHTGPATNSQPAANSQLQ